MMRRLFILSFILVSFAARAQTNIYDTTTLRQRINADIVPNGGTYQLTPQKFNKILNGFMNTWPRFGSGFTYANGLYSLGGRLNAHASFSGGGLYNFILDSMNAIVLTSPNLQFNVGSDAAGDMYYRDNTGRIHRLPKGTAGQFLSTDGAVPLWQSILDSAGNPVFYTDAMARNAIRTVLSSEFSFTDSIRINTIEASKILTNSGYQFVTLANKTYWNNKLNASDTTNRWQPKGSYVTQAQFDALQTGGTASGLTFTDGLVKSSTGVVRALINEPIWPTNRIFSFPISPVICNGCVPYLDSTLGAPVIRWRLPDSATVAPIYDSIAQINLDLLATKLALHDSANRIWDKLNNIGFNVNDSQFVVRPAGSLVGDKDTLELSPSLLTAIYNVTTPGNYVTSPDFFDSLANIRYDLLHNYYTRTESDARFYPLTSNPAGYLTAVPATDDPYRTDSTKILGEDNPRTLTNYYHNGSTSSTTYIDFKADYWRKNGAGDLYHLETNGTGFVGIGTNAPAASMHVAANYSIGSIPGFLLEDKTTPGAFLKVMDGTAATNSMVPTIWGRGVTGQLPHSINNNNRDGLELVGDIGYDTTFNAGVTIIGRNHSAGILTQAPALRITNHLSTIATFNADSTVTFNYLKSGRTIPTQPGTPRALVAYDNGTIGVGTGNGSGSNYTFNNSSIVNTGNNLALAGDAATPAANTVYGVDASGTKGFRNTTSIDNSNMFVGDGVKYAGNGAFVRRPRLTVTSTGTGGTASLDSNANALTINFTASSTNITSTDNYINASGSTINTRKAWNAITWASSITVNAATSSNHTVTLGGVTAITISNPQDGQVILLELLQDATGSRTVTWPSDVDWSWTATGTQPTLKTTPGLPSVITLTYKLATSKWYGTY